MEIKVVFNFDCPYGKNPVEKAEELLRVHTESGDSLLDVARICTRKNSREPWKEVEGIE